MCKCLIRGVRLTLQLSLYRPTAAVSRSASPRSPPASNPLLWAVRLAYTARRFRGLPSPFLGRRGARFQSIYNPLSSGSSHFVTVKGLNPNKVTTFCCQQNLSPKNTNHITCACALLISAPLLDTYHICLNINLV